MIIAFSGASHSGKTTTINKLKEILGNDILIFDEIIRSKISSIDEIRKNPSAYIDLQKEIIIEKNRQEKSAIFYPTRFKVFDRSLIDSYYYLINYVDKANLSQSDLVKYYSLVDMTINFIINNIQNVYNKIIFFTPIVRENIDPMRPSHLNLCQNSEYFNLRMFTLGFISYIINNKIIDANIDFNSESINSAAKKVNIGSFIELVEIDIEKIPIEDLIKIMEQKNESRI